MADEDPYIRSASPLPLINEKPNKFYVHFVYKAAIVAVFVVFLPLLPSQTPEFINQTLHTRSWEFLQLLFVGIAVSYGLFSRKNDEAEKDHSSKSDNAHAYVSRFLEVSSVFEDEVAEDSKVQTWNSQYYREKPMVVVAQESSLLEDHPRRIGPGPNEKPLLLPVRSLKSRVSDSSDFTLEAKELRRSSSFSASSVDSPNSEENVVLRSPIPWRSRSGRMEMKPEIEEIPQYSLPPSMESNIYRPQSSRSPRPNSTPPTPKKLSPAPSLSPPKNVTEAARKDIYYRASPPPPPPPPPPQPLYASPPPPTPPTPKKLSLAPSLSPPKNVTEAARRDIYYRASPPPPPPPPPPQPLYARKPPVVKSNSILSSSVPRVYPKEPDSVLKRASSGAESKNRVVSDGSMAGKSVRTVRAVEPDGNRFVNDGSVAGKLVRAVVESVGSVELEQQSYPHMSEAAFRVYKEGEFDQTMMSDEESDEDESETERDEVVAGEDSNHEGGAADVNQKADEFIAKFREQIRLQRIESIKRSTAQIARNSSR